jgi:hypothetical protein
VTAFELELVKAVLAEAAKAIHEWNRLTNPNLFKNVISIDWIARDSNLTSRLIGSLVNQPRYRPEQYHAVIRSIGRTNSNCVHAHRTRILLEFDWPTVLLEAGESDKLCQKFSFDFNGEDSLARLSQTIKSLKNVAFLHFSKDRRKVVFDLKHDIALMPTISINFDGLPIDKIKRT